MLRIPAGSEQTANIVSLDPGSNGFGVAVLTVDLDTLQIVRSDAWSIFGAKLMNKNSWIEEFRGARVARIHAIQNHLRSVFAHFEPIYIACESPFINQKFPQAGIVLTEVLTSVRQVVMEYSPWCQLVMIDPPTVKRSVGAPGNAPKEVMQQRVMELPDLHYNGDRAITLLDEHAIDALAVGYGSYVQWRQTTGVRHV